MTLRILGADDIAKLLGKGREKKFSDGWVTCCPAHDDRNPSLRVSDGHTTVAFYCYASCDTRDILDVLERQYNVRPTRVDNRTSYPVKPSKTDAETSIAAPPAEDPWHWAQASLLSPPKPNEIPIPSGFTETGRWAWNDSAGNTIMWNIRSDGFDVKTGEHKKHFSPMSVWRNGNRIAWLNRGVPAPRPLYNIDKSDIADPILYVEGEKTADAAISFFGDDFWVTTAGAASSISSADLSVMKDRPLIIATDMDGPGLASASALIKDAPARSITLLRIPTRFFKNGEALGGDLANLAEGGMTGPHLRGLIGENPQEWLVNIR